MRGEVRTGLIVRRESQESGVGSVASIRIRIRSQLEWQVLVRVLRVWWFP